MEEFVAALDCFDLTTEGLFWRAPVATALRFGFDCFTLAIIIQNLAKEWAVQLRNNVIVSEVELQRQGKIRVLGLQKFNEVQATSTSKNTPPTNII